MLATLERGEWIASGEPVVLLGDSGTGKSHLLIGLGIAACQRGLRVRYTTAAALVNELAEAADERTLSRLQAPATHAGSLLCLDEFGYVHLDRAAPNCSSRSSPSVRSGHPWRSPPTHRSRTLRPSRRASPPRTRRPPHVPCPLIETGSESYRLRLTAATRGGAQTS